MQNKKARRPRVNHREKGKNLLPYQDISKKFRCNLRPCPVFPWSSSGFVRGNVGFHRTLPRIRMRKVWEWQIIIWRLSRPYINKIKNVFSFTKRRSEGSCVKTNPQSSPPRRSRVRKWIQYRQFFWLGFAARFAFPKHNVSVTSWSSLPLTAAGPRRYFTGLLC